MKKILLLISVLLLSSVGNFAQSVMDWKTGDFTTEWSEHTWDFSDYIDRGVREYAVLFRYSSGGCKFVARNAIIKVDGQIIASFSDEVSTSGSGSLSWTWKWTVDSAPKTMTITAEVRTDGGTKSNGQIYLIKDGILTVGGQEAISTSWYKNSTGFRAAIISGDVKTIGNQAFYGCGELENIIIENGVEQIGERAFQSCTSLKNIEIPGSVKTIGKYAFSNIDNLQNVVIGDGVQKIRDNAFQHAVAGARIHIPNSVDSIGVGLSKNFIVCCDVGSAAHTYCADANHSVANLMFTGITAEYVQLVTNLDLSSSDTIRARQFADCPKLQNVTLGKNLKVIESQAFVGSPIQKLTIFPSVDNIGEQAFDEQTIIRVLSGSYAETWCKSNNYVLSGALGDFNEYTFRSTFDKNNAEKRESFNEMEQEYSDCQYIIFSELPNIQRILTKDDTRENMATYSFWTNEQIIVKRLSDSEIEVTSYFLEPIRNVAIRYTGEGKNRLIVAFDEIQPLSRITLNVSDIKEESFQLSSPDELFQKVKSIRMHTEISFILPEEFPDNGELGHIPLTPIHAREWIFLITNYANLIGTSDYEETLYSLNGQLFDDSERQHFLSKEELSQLYTKMLNYPHLNVGIMQGANGLASSKAQTLAIKERALLTFHKAHGALALVTHEFAHCLGYKHEDGNMVVAVDENGDRIDVSGAINFSSSPDYTVDAIGNECWRIYSDYHLLETYELFWNDYFHFPTAENEVKYPSVTVKYADLTEYNDSNNKIDYDFFKNEIDNSNGNQTSVTEQITNIHIYTYGKTIIVENATDEILVYDVMGRLVCRDATPCVRAELRMDGAGIYVVKVGNLAKRVIVE